jgi:hypothetical protein
MSGYTQLLKKEPYIIAPDLDISKNFAAVETDNDRSKCGKCGKPLKSPYYLFVGIRPSCSVISAIKCSDLDDEKVGVKELVDEIKFDGKGFNIDSQHQWIFSDQNIMNSKTRICVDCYGEYKKDVEVNDIHFIAIRIRTVYFAVEEYQRRHTPISSAMSDYERYVITLPDRSMVALIGPGEPGWGFWLDVDAERGSEEDRFADFLNIALIPDYDTSNSNMKHDYVDSVLQELRADFIQDKNRLVPNDQELTRWLKKYYGNPDDDSRIKAIEFCKVFTNPKTIQAGDYVIKTKYSVFVHYIDKDWDEFYI